MNLWHDIAPARVRPEDFFAVIEIEKGSKNKYEMDKETGALRLDRILYTSTHYPANYGFIPRTWADDGDPLDVLVLCSECIRPLSLVECYPIGVISMEDSGSLDEKIIAIPFQDPTYNTYQDISELPSSAARKPSRSSSSARTLILKNIAVKAKKGKGRQPFPFYFGIKKDAFERMRLSLCCIFDLLNTLLVTSLVT